MRSERLHTCKRQSRRHTGSSRVRALSIRHHVLTHELELAHTLGLQETLDVRSRWCIVLIKDTYLIISLGVPHPIEQDASYWLTLGIQSPLREGAKRADADVGAVPQDGLMEKEFDHPTGGHVDLNDSPNPRKRLGSAPVVHSIIHFPTCERGISLSLIENPDMPTHLTIVVRRHLQVHTINPQRTPTVYSQIGSASGSVAGCKSEKKSLQ